MKNKKLIQRNKRIKEKNKNRIEAIKKYEDTYKVEPLKFLIIIVNHGQGEFFIKKLINEFNISSIFSCHGQGTATREVYDLLGIGEPIKDVLFVLVKESLLSEIYKMINERFSISRNSNGIAFTLGVNSIIGVLIYRFLTDTKINIKKDGK